jgi:hypothetical protein
MELSSLCSEKVSSSGGSIVQDIKNMKAKKTKDFASILAESKAVQEQMEKEKFKFNQECYFDERELKKQRLDVDIKRSENEILIKNLELQAQAEIQEKMFKLQEIKECRMELIRLNKSPAEIKVILSEMFDVSHKI